MKRSDTTKIWKKKTILTSIFIWNGSYPIRCFKICINFSLPFTWLFFFFEPAMIIWIHGEKTWASALKQIRLGVPSELAKRGLWHKCKHNDNKNDSFVMWGRNRVTHAELWNEEKREIMKSRLVEQHWAFTPLPSLSLARSLARPLTRSS